MRADKAVQQLLGMLAIDPDTEIEIHTPDEMYCDGDDISLSAEEQDSELDRHHARKVGHPVLKAVFEVKQ